MIYKVADSILSPLGLTTEQNYQAVVSGASALKYYPRQWDLPEPFMAALFSDAQERCLAVEGLTRFESLVARSVAEALASVSFDIAGSRVVFILSTTKANVEHLGRGDQPAGVLHPGESALRISRHLGLTTEPIVVCNACVSGLSAVILASRLLEQGRYDYAIVCGADVLNRFVVSGFQSLKALSSEPCRPFDMERLGLNLGEAAATLILSSRPPGDVSDAWVIRSGAVRNDAYDITAPSRSADGACSALLSALGGEAPQSLALVNAHGVASLFMDQMESVAITRAGLGGVAVNSLKGYFGHTLGAAGILETVLTMRALEQQQVIGTRGFEELGVSGQIRVSASHHTTTRHSFIKMLSGFGGSNAALLVSRTDAATPGEPVSTDGAASCQVTHRVVITPAGVTVDGEPVASHATGKALLAELYRQAVGNYPRYHRMDMLSRLGFIASELLIQREGRERFLPTERRAVILFNRSASWQADNAYLATIRQAAYYYPSPALFVYTLPNIVTGEIAIRNGYHGETAFQILARRDEALMRQVQQAAFCDPATDSIISGWLDYEDDTRFEADLSLIENTNTNPRAGTKNEKK